MSFLLNGDSGSARLGRLFSRLFPGRSLPTYYVDTVTGNDSNTAAQAMNPATPWATLSKAIATVPAAGGLQVLVKPGTYAENTGGAKYWNIVSKTFTAPVWFRPWGAGTITITDAGSGTYTLLLNGVTNVCFQGLTFVPVGTTNTKGVIEFAGAISGVRFVDCTVSYTLYGLFTQPNTAVTQSFSFEGCTFSIKAGASGLLLAVWAKPFTSATMVYSLINCTMTGSSTNGSFGTVTTGMLNNTAVNCTVTVSGGSYTNIGAAGFAFVSIAGTLNVSNATFASANGPALVFGLDAVNTQTILGSASGCTVTSTNSHGLLVGGGSSNVALTNCTIDGGDYSLVFKECNGCSATNCTILGGATETLLFKGAVNCTVTTSAITNDGAHPAVAVIVNVVSGNKSSGCVLTHNTITITGSTGVFAWGDSTQDAGGGVCDFNNYIISGAGGAARLGTVRTTANINSLAALQGAWVGYDVPTNDANSVVN